MGLIDFRPFLQVTINGAPLSGFSFSRISSVSVVDQVGLKSDTCNVTWANIGWQRFEMPEPGAELEIAMGSLSNYKKLGKFIVEQVTEADPPRSITVAAKAKAEGVSDGGQKPLSKQKVRSWPAGTTLKAIAEKIAGEAGLEAAVTDAVASIVPGHLDQLNESDMHLLSRLSVVHDLVAKPTGGKLFVGRRAASVDASGQKLQVTPLVRGQVSSWSMSRSLAKKEGKVIALYRDLAAGATVEVEVGSGEQTRRLQQIYRTKDEAQAAAEAAHNRQSRQVESLSVEMPGNTGLAAEGRIEPVNFSGAAGGEWVITSATHALDQGGFRTSIQCERPG